MSTSSYQRSSPRAPWIPLTTQQIRLRNVVQVLGLNFDLSFPVYFSLHSTPSSAPFFTSDRLTPQRRLLAWKEIELRQLPVRLSAPAVVLRVWATRDDGQVTPVTSWAVHFNGLHFLGSAGSWSSKDFQPNTLLFRTPFGFHTALESLIKPVAAQRFLTLQVPQARNSYSLKSLATLHSVQRSVLDECKRGEEYKEGISLHGFCPSPNKQGFPDNCLVVNERVLTRVRQEVKRIGLLGQLESKRRRVRILRDEKQRAEATLGQLKGQLSVIGPLNEERREDLWQRVELLARDKEGLRSVRQAVAQKKDKLSSLSNALFRRKRELISELLVIYPLKVVTPDRYSINDVQLPNAEAYGTETGGAVSVALGYTCHLLAMLSFFLGCPLRYPLKHFGSLSRVVDQVSVGIPDREREFPLYFRGREDMYSKYACYLLNKNVAQLRWYCGLSTADLRATLPNLHQLLHSRLTVPGWNDDIEVAQELTEDRHQVLFSSKSLDDLRALVQTRDPEVETAGNNAVAVGGPCHGKAQERWLNSWRKTRTYDASIDTDPVNLVCSLDLDFDAGRRLSTSGQPPLLIEPPPPRTRRAGRVELSDPLAQESSACMEKAEKKILVAERKKSFSEGRRDALQPPEFPPEVRSRKVSRQSEVVAVPEEELNPLNLPVEEKVSFESSYAISLPQQTPEVVPPLEVPPLDVPPPPTTTSSSDDDERRWLHMASSLMPNKRRSVSSETT